MKKTHKNCRWCQIVRMITDYNDSISGICHAPISDPAWKLLPSEVNTKLLNTELKIDVVCSNNNCNCNSTLITYCHAWQWDWFGLIKPKEKVVSMDGIVLSNTI